MLMAPPASSDGSEAGFSSSSTRTTAVSSRASYAASIAVLPLSTSRLSCGGGGDSRSCSQHLAAAGPVNMRLAAAAASAQRPPAGWSTGSLQAAAMLAAGATGDPLSTASGVCGGDAAARPYAVHRTKCGLYMDPELHVLCLELALHLLVTPTGQLDSVQLPHEPSGACTHWSHPPHAPPLPTRGGLSCDWLLCVFQ
jgi:hypothetical protein